MHIFTIRTAIFTYCFSSNKLVNLLPLFTPVASFQGRNVCVFASLFYLFWEVVFVLFNLFWEAVRKNLNLINYK